MVLAQTPGLRRRSGVLANPVLFQVPDDLHLDQVSR